MGRKKELNGGEESRLQAERPDLGIGGAERMIVDAAVELASHGHEVRVFTSHHDKNRCFRFWYLSSYCIWCLPTPTYILSTPCFVCIYTVPFCCSLHAVHVGFVRCNTGRSGFCCHPTAEA